MIRFALSLIVLLGLTIGVTAFMPRAWLAEPISQEPRSMMGSGFVNDWPDVAPGTYYWADYLDLVVEHPAETNIIIWNHHTEAMSTAPSCLGTGYFPPPSIMALEEIGRTRVFYLCTKSSQDPEKPFYAIQRQEEILALVQKFRDLGVPAERIFLAGQSGGSCSSLFALGAAPDAMNAGILFAPACYGRVEGAQRRSGLLSDYASNVDQQMLAAERVTALLVAFEQDSWNKPAELAYMTDRWPDTRIFSPRCGANHGGAFHGCGLDKIEKEVRRYFLGQLLAKGVALPQGVTLPSKDAN
ncbi:MAG: hypothetical protein AAF557_13770 [Pseudomonadota bacterium]